MSFFSRFINGLSWFGRSARLSEEGVTPPDPRVGVLASEDGLVSLSPSVVTGLVATNLNRQGLVRRGEEDLFLAAFSDPDRLPQHTALRRTGSLMTPDDLEGFGLNRRSHIGVEFFLALSEQGRSDPIRAAEAITRRVGLAISTRRDLERTVSVLGMRQRVTLIADASCGDPCAQVRSAAGETWAGVALDLPLPGCDQEFCLCRYRVEL